MFKVLFIFDGWLWSLFSSGILAVISGVFVM